MPNSSPENNAFSDTTGSRSAGAIADGTRASRYQHNMS